MNLDAILTDNEVYQTTFPEWGTFVWRLLSLSEFRKFFALKHTASMHEFVIYYMVFERCLIGNPKALNQNLPIGIPITLGQLIMWLSGESEYHQPAEDIALIRAQYPESSLKEVMKRVIFTAWPSVTPEQVDNWSYQTLIKRFTEAEYILMFRGLEYTPLDLKKIHDPSKPVKQQSQSIDFRAENRELERALGDRTHPLDLPPDELGKRIQKNEISSRRRIARALDRRKGR